MQLNELDEIRQQAVEHTSLVQDEIRQQAIEHSSLVQQQRIKWHDRFIKNKISHKRDWALLFYSKYKDFKATFATHWLGPYEI